MGKVSFPGHAAGAFTGARTQRGRPAFSRPRRAPLAAGRTGRKCRWPCRPNLLRALQDGRISAGGQADHEFQGRCASSRRGQTVIYSSVATQLPRGSVLFASKTFCLQISPYGRGEDVQLWPNSSSPAFNAASSARSRLSATTRFKALLQTIKLPGNVCGSCKTPDGTRAATFCDTRMIEARHLPPAGFLEQPADADYFTFNRNTSRLITSLDPGEDPAGMRAWRERHKRRYIPSGIQRATQGNKGRPPNPWLNPGVRFTAGWTESQRLIPDSVDHRTGHADIARTATTQAQLPITRLAATFLHSD